MSTRSNIGILEDGRIKYVYCHYDGYIDGVGATLHEYYNNEESSRKIVAGGAISYLAERLNPINPDKHSFGFDNAEDGTTLFYHRDRGEDLQISEDSADKYIRYVSDDVFIEYIYLYVVEKQKWFCSGGGNCFRELDRVMNKEEDLPVFFIKDNNLKEIKQNENVDGRS